MKLVQVKTLFKGYLYFVIRLAIIISIIFSVILVVQQYNENSTPTIVGNIEMTGIPALLITVVLLFVWNTVQFSIYGALTFPLYLLIAILMGRLKQEDSENKI